MRFGNTNTGREAKSRYDDCRDAVDAVGSITGDREKQGRAGRPRDQTPWKADPLLWGNRLCRCVSRP